MSTFNGWLFKLDHHNVYNLLEEFNRNTGKSGKYCKDIPYDYWRAFKSAGKVLVLRTSAYEDTSDQIVFYYLYVEGKEPLLRAGCTSNGIANFLEENITKYSLPKAVQGSRDELINNNSSIEAFKWADSLGIYNEPEIVIDTAPSWMSEPGVSQTGDLNNQIGEIENKLKEKENDNMKGFKFDFGPCTNDNIRMSVYGLAVKNNADTWVSYNVKNDDIIDVDILNFDGRKFMFKMPVAIKDIAIGDIVIHNRVPMFVTGVTDNSVKVVDVRAGERKEIVPTKSPFNFNFITKVVNLFGDMSNGSEPDMPFGNMLPFLMLNDEDGKDMDMDTMLMFMMMQNQSNMNFMQNPMMMYFMMKDNDMNSNMFPLMMMMNMNQSSTIQSIQKQNEENFVQDNIVPTNN